MIKRQDIKIRPGDRPSRPITVCTFYSVSSLRSYARGGGYCNGFSIFCLAIFGLPNPLYPPTPRYRGDTIQRGKHGKTSLGEGRFFISPYFSLKRKVGKRNFGYWFCANILLSAQTGVAMHDKEKALAFFRQRRHKSPAQLKTF